jgi:hypothetical protein
MHLGCSYHEFTGWKRRRPMAEKLALRIILAWMNSKPTKKGWIFPHGSAEIRKLIEEILRNG